MQKILLLVIMILFCMLPILFVAPDFVVEEENAEAYNPIYAIDVDSWVPISHVTATIGGHNMPIYDVGAGNYSVEPTTNGNMVITVTLLNRQFRTAAIPVTRVDLESPYATSRYVEGDQVYIYLTDDVSGIDYDSIYALDMSGSRLRPVSYSAQEGYIVFDYPDTDLNIYITDMADNTLHLLMSINK